MSKYSLRCSDVKDGFSFECPHVETAETREELWKKIEKHWSVVHYLGAKDALGENPKLRNAIENAIRET